MSPVKNYFLHTTETVDVSAECNEDYRSIARIDDNTYEEGFWGDCPEGCWIIVCGNCSHTMHAGNTQEDKRPCLNCGVTRVYPPYAEW